MASILYLDGSTTILPLGFPVEIRPQQGVVYNDLQINVTAGGSVNIPAAALAAKATVNVPTGAKVSFNATTSQFEVKAADGSVLATLPVVGNGQSPKISIGGGDAAQVTLKADGTIDESTQPEDGGQNPNPNPGGEGQTFTLTTKDDIVTGTTGDDTIEAALDNGKLTFTKGDVITDGFSNDNDTLNLTTTANIAAVDAPVVTGIENININVQKVGAFTFDAGKVVGAKNITVNRSDALDGAVDGTGNIDISNARSANFVAGTKVANVTIGFGTGGNAAAAAVVDATKATGTVTVSGVGQGGVTVNSIKDKAVSVAKEASASGSKATVNSSGTVAVTSTVDHLTLQGADAAATYTVDAIAADGSLTAAGAQDLTVKATAAVLNGKTIKNSATGKVTLEATAAAAALDLSKLDSVNSVVLGADFTSGSAAVVTVKDSQLVTTKTNQTVNALTIENAGSAKTGTAKLGLLGDVTFASLHFGTTKNFETVAVDASQGKFTATALDAHGASLVITGGKDVSLTSVANAASIVSTAGKTTLSSTGATAGEQTIVLGTADDTVTVNSIATVFAANLGDGKNTLTITQAKAGSAFVTGAGNDSVTVTNTTAATGEAVSIITGAGDDTIAINGLTSDLVVNGGAGNDTVVFGTLLDVSAVAAVAAITFTDIEVLQVDADLTVNAAQFAGFGASELKGSKVLEVKAAATGSKIDASKIKLEYGTIATVKLTGGAGDDTLIGTNGNDSITAGAGTDTINAGKGADTITLAASNGTDTIVQNKGDSVKASNVTFASTKLAAADKIHFGNNAVDLIKDFSVSGDKLDLTNAGKLASLALGASGQEVATALAEGTAYVVYGEWTAAAGGTDAYFTIAATFDAATAKDALLITDGGTTIANSESILILDDLTAALAANNII